MHIKRCLHTCHAQHTKAFVRIFSNIGKAMGFEQLMGSGSTCIDRKHGHESIRARACVAIILRLSKGKQSVDFGTTQISSW